MSPHTQLLFNIANLVFYAMAGIGAVIIFFKRPKNLAEEMRDCIAAAIAELRKEFREELKACRAERTHQCETKHAAVDKAYTELYCLDRQRRDDLGVKLDEMNDNLTKWQRLTESRLGNIEGRINLLEKNQ